MSGPPDLDSGFSTEGMRANLATEPSTDELTAAARVVDAALEAWAEANRG